MPNIALAFKTEISRVARKEVRLEVDEMKKASLQHRSHISALRKRIEFLERQIKQLRKAAPQRQRVAEEDRSAEVPRRFSATRLATTRRKLGLSAADFGALVGVTGQSIYKWESGEARPRSKQLEAIASVRGIGKREAATRLEAIGKSK
jgi:DNA-binding transcriptional regulator YiaG